MDDWETGKRPREKNQRATEHVDIFGEMRDERREPQRSWSWKMPLVLRMKRFGVERKKSKFLDH